MKRTWRIIPFAALAAAALIFAAGCSDGSSEDWSGQGESVESAGESEQAAVESEQGESVESAGESESAVESVESAVESVESAVESVESAVESESAGESEQAELLVITQDDVLELIQAIGQVAGTNSTLIEYSHWDFPGAAFIEDDAGLAACVQWWFDIQKSKAAPPRISHTRKCLRERGRVSTELLSVDLSEIDWDESSETRTQAERGEIGKRYMTITIEPAEGASVELPEELRAITIAFDSGTYDWRDTVI